MNDFTWSNLRKAIDSLIAVMAEYERHQDESALALGLRDGAIQRFEYSYELAWKTLRYALENTQESGVNLENISRRALYRLAWEAEFISDPQLWIDFNDARNETSHAYKEESAAEVFALIPAFITETEWLIGQLKKRVAA